MELRKNKGAESGAEMVQFSSFRSQAELVTNGYCVVLSVVLTVANGGPKVTEN